jgi:hypothetical protein
MMVESGPASGTGSDRRAPEEIIEESKQYFERFKTLLDELDDAIHGMKEETLLERGRQRGRS